MAGSNQSLHGKVAVVTGAARGIGRATAIAFAREGADVIGLDICAPVDPRSGVTPSSSEDLEETGRLVGAASRRWLGMKLDQRDLPALRAAAVRGEQEFGGIDILFANAGIQSFHPLLEMEDADWRITARYVTGAALLVDGGLFVNLQLARALSAAKSSMFAPISSEAVAVAATPTTATSGVADRHIDCQSAVALSAIQGPARELGNSDARVDRSRD